MMVHRILETVAMTLPVLYFSGGKGRSESSEIIWGQNWGEILLAFLEKQVSFLVGVLQLPEADRGDRKYSPTVFVLSLFPE